jgi:trigger factor
MELTEYLVRQSQRYGMAPEQFAQELQKQGQIATLVSEVARSKALAGVLGRITIKDASGATIDLEALRPQAGEAISEEAAE